MDFREAAAARAAGMDALADRPRERRRSDSGGRGVAPARVDEMRELVLTERDGRPAAEVPGYASITETPYEMYDMFGPYTEVVSRDAFDVTLAANPTVEFALNHGKGGGPSMASTRNNTLDLSADDTGLRYFAYVDPTRTDVADMLKAIERGDLAEASFKFRITSGQWSPDYTEYRILEVDLDGGDVSAVNFGANPHAYTGRAATTPTLDPTLSRLRMLLDFELAE